MDSFSATRSRPGQRSRAAWRGLVFNVSHDGRERLLTEGVDAVFTLPGEGLLLAPVDTLVHGVRGRAFHPFDQFSGRDSWWRGDDHMNMVRHHADRVQDDVKILERQLQGPPNYRLFLRPNQRLALPGRSHHMIKEPPIRHRSAPSNTVRMQSASSRLRSLSSGLQSGAGVEDYDDPLLEAFLIAASSPNLAQKRADQRGNFGRCLATERTVWP